MSFLCLILVVGFSMCSVFGSGCVLGVDELVEERPEFLDVWLIYSGKSVEDAHKFLCLFGPVLIGETMLQVQYLRCSQAVCLRRLCVKVVILPRRLAPYNKPHEGRGSATCQRISFRHCCLGFKSNLLVLPKFVQKTAAGGAL